MDAVDVNGDGLADIVAGTGPGSEGHVKVFRALELFLIESFQPQGPAFTGRIYV